VKGGGFTREELNPTPAEIKSLVLEVAAGGYEHSKSRGPHLGGHSV